MSTKVTKKLEINTKAFIVQAIRDIVSDPDLGLELTKKTEKRLRQAQTGKEKTISFSGISKKYY